MFHMMKHRLVMFGVVLLMMAMAMAQSQLRIEGSGSRLSFAARSTGRGMMRTESMLSENLES